MANGFDSPTSALAAIVECLDGMCARVHVGALGTGETLDCCPGCLLRVETAGLRVRDGLPRSLGTVVRGCHALVLDVVITYTECFAVFDRGGKSRTIEQLTVDGTALIQSWWGALRTLACCPAVAQITRFVSVTDAAPQGNCAGWQMQLEVDVQLCGCA